MIQEWMNQLTWFGAGVFATGAFWYFLSQKNSIAALWTGFGAVSLVLLAIAFQIHNGIQRRHHSEQLGVFLKEAQTLRKRIDETPLPIKDHNDWVDRVGKYLKENFGTAYETKFSDFSGMVFYGDGSERSLMSKSLEGRSRRLNEFISELNK